MEKGEGEQVGDKEEDRGSREWNQDAVSFLHTCPQVRALQHPAGPVLRKIADSLHAALSYPVPPPLELLGSAQSSYEEGT